uniref:Uncharacterized protein n=1 Tax=Glossina palpalis gambiensis TaxID=67801 RepID=A0A1B0AVA8_9MUSC
MSIDGKDYSKRNSRNNSNDTGDRRFLCSYTNDYYNYNNDDEILWLLDFISIHDVWTITTTTTITTTIL